MRPCGPRSVIGVSAWLPAPALAHDLQAQKRLLLATLFCRQHEMHNKGMGAWGSEGFEPCLDRIVPQVGQPALGGCNCLEACGGCPHPAASVHPGLEAASTCRMPIWLWWSLL